MNLKNKINFLIETQSKSIIYCIHFDYEILLATFIFIPYQAFS